MDLLKMRARIGADRPSLHDLLDRPRCLRASLNLGGITQVVERLESPRSKLAQYKKGIAVSPRTTHGMCGLDRRSPHSRLHPELTLHPRTKLPRRRCQGAPPVEGPALGSRLLSSPRCWAFCDGSLYGLAFHHFRTMGVSHVFSSKRTNSAGQGRQTGRPLRHVSAGSVV